MIYLCNDLFLIIYTFVGHEALYLNKNYYKYLKTLRNEFIKNPIKLKYITISYKFPGIGITRLNYNTSRVSFKISKHTEEILIKKNVYLGKIIKNQYKDIFKLNNIEYDIEPSYKIKKLIFKNPNIIFDHDNIYIKKNVLYFDIFRLWSDNLERIKKYKKLWVK